MVIHLNLIVIGIVGLPDIQVSSVFYLMSLDPLLFLGSSYSRLLINMLLHLKLKVVLSVLFGHLRLLYLLVLVVFKSVLVTKMLMEKGRPGMD